VTHVVESTCVAFVPGFMQRGDAWTPVAAHIAGRWRTAFVDFDEPSLDACVGAIRGACPGGAVVGYSMGGRIALHAAVNDPGAFRALVLVGATAGIDDAALRLSRRAADEALAEWMEGQRIETVVDFWESQAVFDTQSDDLVIAQRPGRLSHEPRDLAALLRATGQGVLEPLWDRLAELTIPVLAVAGEDDDKYAELAERLAAALPNGRVAIVAGAGHAAHLEQPEAFADLVAGFLDEHLGKRGVVDRDA
jgi:2-succinyl-6-hydroxy-2,4-cyclohexadiene-1-carboxylate synthase